MFHSLLDSGARTFLILSNSQSITKEIFRSDRFADLLFPPLLCLWRDTRGTFALAEMLPLSRLDIFIFLDRPLWLRLAKLAVKSNGSWDRVFGADNCRAGVLHPGTQRRDCRWAGVGKCLLNCTSGPGGGQNLSSSPFSKMDSNTGTAKTLC